MDKQSPNQQQVRYARILASYDAASADQPPGDTDVGLGKGREQGVTSEKRSGADDDDNFTRYEWATGEAAFRYCPLNENLLPFKLLYIFYRGAVACIMPYLTVFLNLTSMSPSGMGLLMALPALLTAVFTPLCGIVADKFQSRKPIMLICLTLWVGLTISANFVEPLEPAPCPVIVSNLQEITEGLPKDSWQFWRLQCMINGSRTKDIPPSFQGEETSTSKSQWIPLLQLLSLPDSFASSYEDTCKASSGSAAALHHLSTSHDSIKSFGKIFNRGASLGWNGTNEGLNWLFNKTRLLQTFTKVFVLLSLADVMQRPTVSLTDTATLNELGQDSWDRYGWQRSFGSAGFALYSLVMAFLLVLLRYPTAICFLDIEVIDYSIGIVMFTGTLTCAFGLLFACCFKFKYTTNAEYKFRNVLPAFCTCYYGSVMLTAFVLAVCNGCVSGFLFMHLRNLGATDIFLSFLLAVRAGSELLLAFHAPRLIGCFGHVPLLGIGLIMYAIRFICYGYVTDPWLVLPVEVLHGMSIALTWNILVSFISRAVSFECMATLQGLLSGVYFGLGYAVGAVTSGLLVEDHGFVFTFYAFSLALLCYLVIFLLAFKSFRPLKITPTSYQLVASKNPPW